jgi:hypothetical protein
MLTVAFLSIFSVFEVILEGMKLRGCANRDGKLTLTWGLGQPTKTLTDGERRSLRWTSIVKLNHSFVGNAWLEYEHCAV